MKGTLCVVALCVVAATATAQRTWIVDASGNGDFRTLGQAFSAARDGDTVRIRPGTYNGSSTSKALRILGDPPGVTVFTPRSGWALRIHDLAKGKHCVLKGISTWPPLLPFSPTFLRIDNCQGHVTCDRITAVMHAVSRDDGGRPVQVTNSAHVTFHRCRFGGRNDGSMVLEGSAVVVNQCRVDGQSCSAIGCLDVPGPAITVRDSTLVVTESQLTGGAGGRHFLTNQIVNPAPAVRSTNSFLTISGSAASVVRAGGNVAAPVSAIAGSGGGVQRDPRVRVLANGNAPPISPGIPSRTLRLPAILNVVGAPPGGKVQFELLATKGNVAEMYLSLPGYPWRLPIPDSGLIWIEPLTWIVLGRALIGASERVSWTLPIPNLPGLRGLPLNLQAVTVSPQTIRFSTPAPVVLD